jgi:hypothetical protein
MGYLINDNLIWVITPRCASNSVETALINSNLKSKKYNNIFNQERHIHVSLDKCLDYFGKKETVCITRDWFERWMSALNFIWDKIEYQTPFEPICKWEDLNNDIIYNLFDSNFISDLHYITEDGFKKCFFKFLKTEKEKVLKITPDSTIVGIPCTLVSEKFWKSNKKCTYEFDITELNKFVDFIENKFGERLLIEKLHTSTKRESKITVNDELKSFVWNNFEKIFEKRKQLT